MSRRDDLEGLIARHRRRLQKLREQAALEGLKTDPAILIEIEEIETAIESLQAELSTLEDILTLKESQEIVKNVSERKGTQQRSIRIAGEQKSKHRLRVFLCHSSDDKPSVRNLYYRLQADGLNPWLDEEKLLPGQKWKWEIRKAVKSSDAVIVCLSRGSTTRGGYIQEEIEYALDVADGQSQGSIFIIPLRLDRCEVPERLRHWHWVNFFEEEGYDRLMRALQARAKDIGAIMMPPARPTSSSSSGLQRTKSSMSWKPQSIPRSVAWGSLAIIILVLLVLFAIAVIRPILEAGRNFITTPIANSTPITKVDLVMRPSGPQLSPGQQVALAVEVVSNTEIAAIKWSAESGTFSRTEGQSVIYVAPDTPGTYRILVRVEGGGSIVERSEFITVISPTSMPTITLSPITTSCSSARPILSDLLPDVEVQITSHSDCDEVGERIIIEGVYSGDLTSKEIIVLVYPTDLKYYPMFFSCDPLIWTDVSGGRWNTIATFGGPPQQFDIIAITVDVHSSAYQVFDNWAKQGCQTSDFPGFIDPLPDGVTEMHAITVIKSEG